MITFIESGNRIATENFQIGEIYTITFTNGNYKTMCCVGIGTDFVMFQDKLPNALFCLTMGTSETVLTIDLGGGGSGTMNYNELENKPQINGIVLIGNKTASDLNLVSQTDLDNYVTDTELTTELADYATNASVTAALASKQNQLTTTQLTAVNSGITSSLVNQITTNKNNILLNKSALTDIINSGGKNSFDISTITYATSVAVSGTTMTMNDVDSKQYLNFMVQRYQNTTAGSTIASLNCQTNTIYTVEFTKDNTFNTLSMGHNGRQKDGKFRTDVSNLTDGVTYVIQFEVINCNKDYGNFSWKNIMITPKSLYQISDDYDDYCPTLAELYALVKSYHP